MSASPSFLVLDDFLDEEAWTEVWTMFQFVELAPVARTAGAWKADDGAPLGGDAIVTPARDAELGEPGADPARFPSGTALDHVLAHLETQIRENPVHLRFHKFISVQVDSPPCSRSHGSAASSCADPSLQPEESPQ